MNTADIRPRESTVSQRVASDRDVVIRQRGLLDYASCWQEMRAFTQQRHAHTLDEIWSVQHAPTFTLGLAGKMEHVLDPGAIPVVRSDRGGQATYHGPGQAVLYVLCDLKRSAISVRGLVDRLEQCTIEFLASHGVIAERRSGAPGVYVKDAKIAALGLRVLRGCSYHGLALNVDMDLAPFSRINPCGYAGLRVTQLRDLGIALSVEEVAAQLSERVAHRIGMQ